MEGGTAGLVATEEVMTEEAMQEPKAACQAEAHQAVDAEADPEANTAVKLVMV